MLQKHVSYVCLSLHVPYCLLLFAFQELQVNSFEQLCINYANETLQFFFNKVIFQEEQVSKIINQCFQFFSVVISPLEMNCHNCCYYCNNWCLLFSHVVIRQLCKGT